MKTILKNLSVLWLALAVSFTMIACDDDKDTEPDSIPEAAGTISGDDEGEGTVILEIGEIKYARTYKWYKDGEAVQNTSSRQYTVTESGYYTVAGVNTEGEGVKSPRKKVTITGIRPVDLLPEAAGEISGANSGEDEVLLEIAEIDRADTYRWFRDGEEVQDNESRQFKATVSGDYTVAGVNQYGEGTLSPVKTVLVTYNNFFIEGPDNADDVVMLTAPEVPGVERYKWYRDGKVVQFAAQNYYEAMQSGTYTVSAYAAGVEGDSTPGKTVAIANPTAPADRMAGNWFMEGIWFAGPAYFADRNMVFEKIDANTLLVSPITYASVLSYDPEDPLVIGDEIKVVVNDACTKLYIEPRQQLLPSWSNTTSTVIIPMTSTNYLEDWDSEFPEIDVISENGTLFIDMFQGPVLRAGGLPFSGFCYACLVDTDTGQLAGLYGRVMGRVRNDVSVRLEKDGKSPYQ